MDQWFFFRTVVQLLMNLKGVTAFSIEIALRLHGPLIASSIPTSPLAGSSDISGQLHHCSKK
jgi:hypothetical protein